MGCFRVIDKILNFLDDGIPKNDFDRELLASNLIGAQDLKELSKRERIITLQEEKKLAISPIKGDFDYKHLKEIHKFLFKNIYTWAGTDRAEMGLYGYFGKGNSSFCKGEFLHKEADRIFKGLKEQNFLRNAKDINSFAKDMANFMADLNALHPFREGNGRTQRIFLNELAKNAGYKLDLGLIKPDRMIAASIDAMIGKNTKLETLIRSNLREFRQNLDLEQSRGLRLE